ncbi:hypothetical protein MKW92_031690 [Papaver armeniacum]|nr:hypothetical protein MKW92_031690 [Papaver armeniacum]
MFTGKDNLRCLIPCAIDQDPYFRMTRDVAPKIGYQKPALIDDPNSAIYINKHAFSGGGKSKKEHQQNGANLKTDIPFKYLQFFLDDDAELEHVEKEYGSGKMLSGEIKNRVIKVLTQLVEKHRKARAAVTEAMVDAFMAVRPLPNMFD